MDEDSFDEDNFIELEIDSKLLELSGKPQLTGRKTITLRDLVSSLKKAKTKRCPICGRKMRRLYVKQGYRKVIRKTVKHKTYWWRVGWWCPICDYVEINPELPKDDLQIWI